PERVTQKVKALLTRLLDAGLRLIQGDPHPCYHLPRPIQCLSRFAATENHEIVRVVHDMSVKLLSPFGVPPTLQQTVHVQVGEHRAGDSPYAKGNLWPARLRNRHQSSVGAFRIAVWEWNGAE